MRGASGSRRPPPPPSAPACGPARRSPSRVTRAGSCRTPAGSGRSSTRRRRGSSAGPATSSPRRSRRRRCSTPIACRRANSAATRSESPSAALSVISSVSRVGARPVSRRASTTWSAQVAREDLVHGDVHRDAEVGWDPGRCRQRSAARQARRSTSRPILLIAPDSSAIGDEHVRRHGRLAGPAPPREGLQHRRPPRAQVDHRLEGDVDLAALHGAGQLLLQARPVRGLAPACPARTPRPGPCPCVSPRTSRCPRRAAARPPTRRRRRARSRRWRRR